MSNLSRRQMLAVTVAATALTTYAPMALAADIPAPKGGGGVVVFYRGGANAGNAVRFSIEDANGNVVAHLQRGAIEPVHVPAGDNFFRVPEANNTEGTIPVKAGETVWIRCFLDAATNTGKLQFQRVDEARARKELRI